MCRPLRHVLAWIVAFALVASGAASSQCAALHLAAAPTAAGAMDAGDHASHHAHRGMDHHVMDHRHGTNKNSAPTDDHACMKCCAMCIVAGALPPVTDDAMPFAASPVAFFGNYEEWSANAITVDPGIPKRIT